MNLLILLLAALILTVNGCLRVRWPEKCSPTDPSIFLFAYSNDMNYTEVLGKLRWLEVRVIGRHHKYVVAATVRFDTKRKEEIVFYANDTMSNSFLTARDYVNITRDPSQSFDNSETGSDVLDMLDRYIDSGHPLICGSRAFIFIKRSPNEVEISKIVRKIRQYHIELNIAFENPTSGGLHPETIYNLAAKTNGYCTFSNGTSRVRGTENRCSPTGPSSILFAYSNDLDYVDVEYAYTRFEGPITYNEEDKYYKMAIARFDTKTKEEIVFFQNLTLLENYQSAHDHMNKLKVDPSQKFDSSETGSDVLDMLERFVDSGQPLICGSRAIILMKRSPNEVDISKIVRKIRQHHIDLNIAFEDPSSGGIHPETMYNLAAKTNGYCSFSSGLLWAISTLPQITEPYIHYSLNIKVSGTGTMVLPSITLPQKMSLVFYLAVQSTATTTSFENFTISYVNTNGFSNSYSRNREKHLKQGSFDGYDTSLNSFRTVYFLLSVALRKRLRMT
ncbi:unnamed protein product [Caenorhabditis nigoni]